MGTKPAVDVAESAIDLDKETRLDLARIATISRRSPRTLVRRAVREFIEDYYDLLVVRERLRKPGRTVSLDAVLRRNGLAR